MVDGSVRGGSDRRGCPAVALAQCVKQGPVQRIPAATLDGE